MARGDLRVVASPEAAEQVALCVQAAAEQAASIVREQASSSTVAAEPAESAAGILLRMRLCSKDLMGVVIMLRPC